MVLESPGKNNISDFPARFVGFPYRLRAFKEFSFTENLLRMIRIGLKEGSHGFFDPTDLVGSFYQPTYGASGCSAGLDLFSCHAVS